MIMLKIYIKIFIYVYSKLAYMACKNQLHIKKKYSCEACQYTTCSKKDFIKHISTKKHTKNGKPVYQIISYIMIVIIVIILPAI